MIGFDIIDEALNEIERRFFAPVSRKIVVIPIVIKAKGDAPKEEVKTTPKDEGKCSPAPDTIDGIVAHKEPVYGVFHGAKLVDGVEVDINGNTVYMDIADVKKLYAQLGPALKRYKKEHATDE